MINFRSPKKDGEAKQAAINEKNESRTNVNKMNMYWMQELIKKCTSIANQKHSKKIIVEPNNSQNYIQKGCMIVY